MAANATAAAIAKMVVLECVRDAFIYFFLRGSCEWRLDKRGAGHVRRFLTMVGLTPARLLLLSQTTVLVGPKDI